MSRPALRPPVVEPRRRRARLVAAVLATSIAGDDGPARHRAQAAGRRTAARGASTASPVPGASA